MRPKQACNLSEIVARAGDTLDDLKAKARKAAILGTLQSTLTDFRYLRAEWKRNIAEECLLGVSITGIMDHCVLSGRDTNKWNVTLEFALEELKKVVIDTNKEWAEKLGINQSTSVTAVKPSGTVSQLVDSASGIHPRFSKYYIRRVRADIKDPLTTFMKDVGIPYEEDVMNNQNIIFSFPHKSPEGAVCTSEMGAMEQLRLWQIYQDHWCEHKPSITVYYKDSEFLQIGQWLYNNFDKVSGVSFLPYSDHTYKQAPYEEITEEVYNELLSKMPVGVDWNGLTKYELEDTTTGTQELACTAGVCEIVDITQNNSTPTLIAPK